MAKQLVIDKHVIDAPLVDIILAIKAELTNGKLRSYKVTGDSVMVPCPFHKKGLEKHFSCGLYCGTDPTLEYGHFNCLACGESGSLAYFVGECFDEDEDFGKKWLVSHFGNDIVENTFFALFKWKEDKKIEYMDESVLSKFQPWHPYMEKRKLSPEVCKYFEVMYDPESECVVFPVRDETGKLYMLTRRSVNSKQFLIPKDKEKPVYLLYEIRRKGISEVVVTESQINCLTVWKYGIPAIATFGCNITDHQFDLLNKSEIKHYYLCLDGDAAGRKGTRKFLKNIRKDVIVDVYDMPEGMDVNDITEEEFNKVPILNRYEWEAKYGSKD